MRDLHWKYYWKKCHAKERCIPFLLTFSQYSDLCIKAGITSEDIGRHTHQYQLARYGDVGSYSIDNCRFITKLENTREMLIRRTSTQQSQAGKIGGKLSRHNKYHDKSILVSDCPICNLSNHFTGTSPDIHAFLSEGVI
jgi:hypothetical protein